MSAGSTDFSWDVMTADPMAVPKVELRATHSAVCLAVHWAESSDFLMAVTKDGMSAA